MEEEWHGIEIVLLPCISRVACMGGAVVGAAAPLALQLFRNLSLKSLSGVTMDSFYI